MYVGSFTASSVNDNTVIYTSGDIEEYDYHVLEIVTAPGTNALDAVATIDGSNYSTDPISWLTLGDGATQTSVPAAIGFYAFEGKVKGLKIANAGATTGAAAVIRVAHFKKSR